MEDDTAKFFNHTILAPEYRDELTNLPNRRWLNDKLAESLTKQPGNFGILFVDIDGLKTTNDTLGHQAGDQLIINAAGVMLSTLRTHEDENRIPDTFGVARNGGDEFIILLNNIDSDEKLEAAKQRLRVTFEAHKIKASIGGRIHDVDDLDAAKVLADSDRLMYEDKRQRKTAYEQSLPTRKQLAAKMGRVLLKYAGMPNQR
jgi:diguanylate cyclase (GGDEF)-like protein